MSAQIVDSHVHLWDPDRLHYAWLEGSALHRRTDATDLLATAGESAQLIVVQADCDDHQALAEVEWLTQQAAQVPDIRGVVAFAPIERAGAADALTALADLPFVVGVRRLLQDEPVGFALEPGFLKGVAHAGNLGLPFDVCIREHQLREAAEMVRRTPGTVFVLDHLGKPRVGATDGDWFADLADLATLPNVWCKLSGLATEACGREPTPELIAPYLKHGLDQFGSRRCLFGSDWPVSTEVIDYAMWRDLVGDVVEAYGSDAVDQVFSANARAVYG